MGMGMEAEGGDGRGHGRAHGRGQVRQELVFVALPRCITMFNQTRGRAVGLEAAKLPNRAGRVSICGRLPGAPRRARYGDGPLGVGGRGVLCLYLWGRSE